MLSGFFQKKPILCINAKVLTVKDGYILSWQATEQHKKSLSSCLQVVVYGGFVMHKQCVAYNCSTQVTLVRTNRITDSNSTWSAKV
jgi:hypothetical protein